jgi:hypothetical protein
MSEGERKAENESRLRQRNEELQAHNAAYNWVDPPYADWLCECGDLDCTAPVQLTVREYESVRDVPTHFLVSPSHDHVEPEIERVVEQNDRYWVVQKLGLAGVVAQELDPRSDSD